MGQVQGCVERYDYVDDQIVPSDNALSGMKLILRRRDGPEEYVSRTNGYGQFFFKNLRPGDWFLAIDSERIPKTHEVQEARAVLHVAAGETAEAVFHLMPVAPKPVQWIEESL